MMADKVTKCATSENGKQSSLNFHDEHLQEYESDDRVSTGNPKLQELKETTRGPFKATSLSRLEFSPGFEDNTSCIKEETAETEDEWPENYYLTNDAAPPDGQLLLEGITLQFVIETYQEARKQWEESGACRISSIAFQSVLDSTSTREIDNCIASA